MTKGIEDFLNISSEKTEEQKDIVSTNPTSVPAVDNHDIETEDVRQRALSAFDDIMELGKNVEPSRSARMFEVAGQFLKTGLDASNSKADKHLKVAKLKLEARRLRVDDSTLDQLTQGAEIIADRNALIKQLIDESENNTIEVEPKETE